ncbi:MAG: hypothetical protein V1837_00655 [Candidatus Woesearchaeota archaeon]
MGLDLLISEWDNTHTRTANSMVMMTSLDPRLFPQQSYPQRNLVLGDNWFAFVDVVDFNLPYTPLQGTNVTIGSPCACRCTRFLTGDRYVPLALILQSFQKANITNRLGVYPLSEARLLESGKLEEVTQDSDSTFETSYNGLALVVVKKPNGVDAQSHKLSSGETVMF